MNDQQTSCEMENFRREYEPPWEDLDPGIRHEVKILFENGIHTTQSCEGSKGHVVSEPTVWFNGQQSEGFKALAIALENGLKVTELRRTWRITDGEPVGPEWVMVFYHRDQGLQAMFGDDGMCTGFEWR